MYFNIFNQTKKKKFKNRVAVKLEGQKGKEFLYLKLHGEIDKFRQIEMNNISRQQNKFGWQPSQLSIIVVVLSWISGYSQVSMETINHPYPGLQRIFTYITTAPLVQPLTFTYTYSYVHQPAPLVMTSMIQLEWAGQLKFEFRTPTASTNTSGFTFQVINFLQTDAVSNYINKFAFLHAVYDPQIYLVTNAFFQFVETSSTVVPQLINITALQYSSYSMLTAFEDYIDPLIHTNTVADIDVIYALRANQYVFGIQVAYNLSYQVSGTNGYIIKRLRYEFYNVTVPQPFMMDRGYALQLFSASASNCNAFRIQSIQSNESSSHFYGINSIWGFNSSSGNVASVTALTLSGINAKLSGFSMIWRYRKCPLGYPFIYAHNYTCGPQCLSNSYQLTLTYINNYYICILCNWQCTVCSNASNNCTACIPEYRAVLVNPVVNFSECLCPYGFYGDPLACILCNASIPYCSWCSNSTVCERCYQSLMFNSTTGVCECGNGTTLHNKTVTYYDSNQVLVTTMKPMCINVVRVVESCNNLAINLSFGISTGLIAFGQTCQCFNALLYINNICIRLH